MERHFSGTYTVKVADVCYTLIGQIVNRHLLAVRYQSSGGPIVNSPLEAPSLAEKVRKDCIRSQKVRNCILRAPRTAKELHWPFGDTLLPNVTILFRDVLNLSNEG